MAGEDFVRWQVKDGLLADVRANDSRSEMEVVHHRPYTEWSVIAFSQGLICVAGQHGLFRKLQSTCHFTPFTP